MNKPKETAYLGVIKNLHGQYLFFGTRWEGNHRRKLLGQFETPNYSELREVLHFWRKRGVKLIVSHGNYTEEAGE